MNSNLLSGGIENKYLGILSDHSLNDIKTLAKLANDEEVVKAIEKGKDF